MLQDFPVFEQVKATAKAHNVTIPALIAALVEHVYTSDNGAAIVADIAEGCDKAAKRGRKASVATVAKKLDNLTAEQLAELQARVAACLASK